MLSIDQPARPAESAQPAPTKRKPSVEEQGNSNRLIFVDDDDIYRSIVKSELAEEGFSILDFASGEEMLASLRDGAEADIIVLDWGLEKANGIDLLPTLHDLGIDLPVVFLTGRSSPVHERLAFLRGAVDFIDKSRGTGILATRLRLIVTNRRQAPDPGDVFQCGRLILKPEAGRAYWDDVDLNLTLSEYKIVHLIATHAGEYVPYRQIYDAIHYVGFMAGTGEHGYRANVRSSIKRIRNKFREYEPAFDKINNYAGFGYCWGKRGE